MLVLSLALFAFYADDGVEVLRRTALAYEKLRSFEITASLTVKVPGQDVIITTGQTAIYAKGEMLPADAALPLLDFGMVSGRKEYRNSAGQEVKAANVGFSLAGFPFSLLDVADKRVTSVRALPDEALQSGGESIPCAVVEAVYEKRSPFDRGSGRPVRYWIEKSTSLVRQVAYEREWRGGVLAQWTARVEKTILDQPPPQWALKEAPMGKGREEEKWAGQPARGFELEAVDGGRVSLASMRGKVVVLDFWATWCGPCREEMPLLEKLRNELSSKGVEVWGVTDEAAGVARQWLADRKRKLPTLVDAGRELFRHYSIESIPVLIVIGADGKISTFVVGLRGERDLRADIAKAMK